ncbi:hypothetical protein ABZ816_15610 [Actinosynnema sp. NPDC047251]|uniref:Putative secreted protein n=1 Tax=Saccharothrix espanaensis (strain ATCC 51144 / DSM 44229 / JCM 9112 / NBRC 15066 / NRRL 15764) TaxID=1179773 RepID=K0JXX4_SACES|nr:hypothetical protein [Saccharothrix espanaensis]CCH29554.1 putative secreted protein [Saccharothrix espanaensis DSM 44229]
MNHRIAAALIGTALGLATFAGPAAAAPINPDPSDLQQDYVSELICDVLEDLDLLDHPELEDLVDELNCDGNDDGNDDDDNDDDPTTTTTPTTTPTASLEGRR